MGPPSQRRPRPIGSIGPDKHTGAGPLSASCRPTCPGGTLHFKAGFYPAGTPECRARLRQVRLYALTCQQFCGAEAEAQ